MSGFDFDASDLFNHLDIKEKGVFRSIGESMNDSTDDVKRISSEIAPIKGSNLRKSVHTKVTVDPSQVVGEVDFGVTETTGKGRFNYALWIHEMDYELGEQSADAPGTDGYGVGNKYLERPLKGEAEKYVKWWAEAISKELD